MRGAHDVDRRLAGDLVPGGRRRRRIDGRHAERCCLWSTAAIKGGSGR